MKKVMTTILTILNVLLLSAQGETSTGGSLMRSHHKIFVAVGVLAIILTAVFVFLFMIERRLKNLEDKQTKLS